MRAKDIKGAVSFWSAEHQIKIFDVRWQKIFGGSKDDYGYSVQQTTDSGYIIIGYTYSFGNYKPNVYLVKTDESGNLL